MSGDPILRVLLVSCCTVLAVVTPAGANLLVNASFESPGGGAGCGLRIAPSTEIPGWVVTRTNIHYCHSSVWQVSDGVRNIDLDGGTGFAGGIAQTFATVPGQIYKVSWDLAGNPGAGPTVKTMRIEAAGQGATFTFSIAGKSFTNMGYIRPEWSFTANSTSTMLELYSLTAPAGWGPVIDNVVVDVPVPVGSGTWGRLKILYR
jgi:choice-of-anchor C domain-containing protein